MFSAESSKKNKASLLPFAIKVYEQCRIKRSSRVVEGGLTHQHYWHLHDGPEQQQRDLEIGKEPADPGCSYRWKCPEFSDWLFSYDPILDAEEAWEVMSKANIRTRL